MTRLQGLFAAAVLIVGAAPAFGQQAQLSVSQASVVGAIGYRITNAGVIVGESRDTAGFYEPTVWNTGFSMEQLKHPDNGFLQAVEGSARGIASNGAMVGYVNYRGARRACRWTSSSQPPTILDSIVGSDTVASEANDVAWTSGAIVGKTKRWGGVDRAFSWTQAGGMIDLGSIDGGAGSSEALAVSGDGLVVVGASSAAVGGPLRAFRWTSAGMEDLGTLDGAGESCARDVSTDGLVVVGESTLTGGLTRGFVYTAANGMTELPTIGDYPGDCFAATVSDDGRTVAGSSASDRYPEGEACVWFDGVAHSMETMLQDEYRVDLQGKTFLCACVSPDGRRFSGQGIATNRPTAFKVRIAPELQYPVVTSEQIEQGRVYLVRVGETMEVTATATDPDGGRISLVSRGGPSGLTMAPDIGTNGPSPYSSTARWTPGPTAFGQTYIVRFGFSDNFEGSGNFSFTVKVAPNVLPTVAPVAPETLECVDGYHTVRLSTVIGDEEGQPLKVVWRVDGVDQKTTTDVPPGSEVDFEYAYPHGRHRVEVRVSDARDTTTRATTVTVLDSTAPVLVTQDVVASADPGQAFASNVTLPEPTASDASGDPVTLTQGETPETFPVGTTLVVWTATDAAGNVTSAGQKVTVEDREPPAIAEGEGMTVYVDPGKLYSTARPPLPTASDNVSAASAIRIASDAPARLPLGVTNVTFRATDEAGNSAERTTTTTVVNRLPHANVGTDVVVTTKSEKGIRVSLDGRASFDPDQQALKFAWSAPGARLGGKLTATPAGTFPVGKTFATLTVTDPAGAKHSDRVRVVVRLQHARQRPRGRDANRSFAAASQQARKAVAAKGTNAAALSALAYANAAAAYGDAAGEFVRSEDGQSEQDATFSYSELRAVQRTYGQAAATALLSAYAETGDENLLSAYRYAAYGTAYADADLAE